MFSLPPPQAGRPPTDESAPAVAGLQRGQGGVFVWVAAPVGKTPSNAATVERGKKLLERERQNMVEEILSERKRGAHQT